MSWTVLIVDDHAGFPRLARRMLAVGGISPAAGLIHKHDLFGPALAGPVGEGP